MRIFTKKPVKELSPYINCFWSIESTKGEYVPEQLIYPEATTDLIFHYGSPFKSKLDTDDYITQSNIIFCGQKTMSAKVISGYDIGMIAVNFNPFGASAFFNIPFGEIRNQNLNAVLFLSNDIKLLNEKLALADSFQVRVELLEHFLKLSFVNSSEYELIRLNAAYLHLKSNLTSFKVEDFAKSSCFSFRTLDRVFRKRVGLSPKEFLKIERLKYAIELMKSGKKVNLTGISHAAGYYDQSHFNKDFTGIVGMNPKSFSFLLAEEPACLENSEEL